MELVYILHESKMYWGVSLIAILIMKSYLDKTSKNKKLNFLFIKNKKIKKIGKLSIAIMCLFIVIFSGYLYDADYGKKLGLMTKHTLVTPMPFTIISMHIFFYIIDKIIIFIKYIIKEK